MSIILHPSTKRAIENFISSPRHAVLVEGEPGSGRSTVAAHIASTLIGTPLAAPDVPHPYVRHIFPADGSSIGVEVIRDLQQFLKLKTTGTQSVRRIVIIEDAGTMTVEAQNALLKVLEEPPLDTLLILTGTPSNDGLLPTVVSRTQRIRVLPPPINDLETHFLANGFQNTDIKRSLALSDGLPGLATALLADNTAHPLVSAIATAKELLSADMYTRLTRVDSLAKDKLALPQLLTALQRVTQALFRQAIAGHQTGTPPTPRLKKLHTTLEAIMQAQNSLSHNPNMKLLLSDLFVHL